MSDELQIGIDIQAADAIENLGRLQAKVDKLSLDGPFKAGTSAIEVLAGHVKNLTDAMAGLALHANLAKAHFKDLASSGVSTPANQLASAIKKISTASQGLGLSQQLQAATSAGSVLDRQLVAILHTLQLINAAGGRVGAATTSASTASIGQLTQAVNGLLSALKQVPTATPPVQAIQPAANAAASGVNNLVSSLLRVAAASFGVGELKRQLQELVDVAIKSDRMMSGMTLATGSKKKAAEELGFVREQAERLGLPLEQASEAYTRMSIAAHEAGMQHGPLRQLFLGVSEYATVAGISTEQYKGTVLALDQMLSKGKVSMEELRRQFGNHLPGAMSIAAKSIGVTTQQLEKMVTKGGLDAVSFLNHLGPALRRAAESGLPEAMQNTQQKVNRLNNAIFELRQRVLEGAGSEKIKSEMDTLSDALRDPKLVNFFQVITAGLLRMGSEVLHFFKDVDSAGLTMGVNLQKAFSHVREFFSSTLVSMGDELIKFNNRLDRSLAGWAERHGFTKVASFFRNDEKFGNDMRNKLPDYESKSKWEQDFRKGVDDYYAQVLADREKRAKEGKKFNTPGIVDDPSKVKTLGDDSKGAGARFSAEEQAAAKRARTLLKSEAEALALSQKQLELAFAQKLKTQAQFNTDQAALQQASIDKQVQIEKDLLAQLRALQAKAPDEAKRTKIDADIEAAEARLQDLASKRVQIGVDLKVKEAVEKWKVEDLRIKLQAELLTTDGRPLEAALLEIANKFKLLRLEHADDPAALDLLDNREKQEVNSARLTEVDRQIGFDDKRLSIRETQLQQQYNAGLLTTIGLNRQLQAAREEAAAALEKELKQLEALLATRSGDTALQLQVDELKTKISGLKQDTTSLWAGFATEAGNAFTSALENAKNMKQFFLGFLKDLLGFMKSTFAKQLGDMLTNALKGSADGKEGGGLGGLLTTGLKGLASLFGFGPGQAAGAAGTAAGGGDAGNGVLGALMKGIAAWFGGGFKSGGYTGSGSSDEVAGPAHRNEFVFDEAATKRWGLPTLEAMRTGKLPASLAAGAANTPALKSLASRQGPASNPVNNFVGHLHLDPEDAAAAVFNTKNAQAMLGKMVMANKRTWGIA